MKIGILVVILVACITAESYAHNVHILAEMEETGVSGYVYSSDGRRVQDANVKLCTVDGKLIRQTRTNEGGEFQFTVNQRTDLTLVAETKDGHLAEWSLSANEIPEPLPDPTIWKEGHSSSAADHRNIEDLELRKMIREELKPLEAQLIRRNEEFERFRHEIRWRDIVGGIGYLVGIAGIACFLRAGKKQLQE